MMCLIEHYGELWTIMYRRRSSKRSHYLTFPCPFTLMRALYHRDLLSLRHYRIMRCQNCTVFGDNMGNSRIDNGILFIEGHRYGLLARGSRGHALLWPNLGKPCPRASAITFVNSHTRTCTCVWWELVYVCVCVCVCVCVRACVWGGCDFKCIFVCFYLCVHVRTCVNLLMCAYVPVHSLMDMCWLCVRAYGRSCMFVRVGTCTYMHASYLC